MNAIVLRGLLWLDDFLKDGTTGGRSSSRLIACGSATIMALYLLADIVARLMDKAGMNENVAITCVVTLGALGGVVYGANKVAGTKRAAQETGE